MEIKGEISMIEAARNEPARILIRVTDSTEVARLSTISPLVLDVALNAFMFGSTATFETYGESCVLRRIHPFTKGNQPPAFPDGRAISRIATQGDLSGDHLEVFLKKGNDEVAFNVFDPLVQRVVLTAHRKEDLGFDATDSDGVLTGARLGGPII